MRNFVSWTLVLGLAVVVALPLFAQQSEDEKAIEANVNRWVEAWNEGDIQALNELYTSDADFVSPTGVTVKGRDEVVSGFSESHSTIYKGTQLSVEVTNIRFLKPNLAVTENAWQFKNLPETEGDDPPTRGTTTAVVVKQDGKWQIAAHRSRVPVAASGSGQ